MNEVLTVIAYCGLPPSPSILMSRWNLDLLLLAVLGAGILVHARHVKLLEAPTSQQTYFCAGWTALVLALVSPICALSVALFSARVTQHMWIIFVAVPLLLLASPRRSQRGSKAVTTIVSAAIFAVCLWMWHVPAMYASTFTSDVSYWLMHISLTLSALWLWHSILNTAADLALIRLVIGFFTLLHMGMLGALITLAPRLLYSPHVATAPAWGFTPLADQQLGGLIMWVPAGAALVLACLLTVAKLLHSADDALTHVPRV